MRLIHTCVSAPVQGKAHSILKSRSDRRRSFMCPALRIPGRLPVRRRNPHVTQKQHKQQESSHPTAKHTLHHTDPRVLHPEAHTETHFSELVRPAVMKPAGVSWKEDRFGNCYPEWTSEPKVHAIEEEVAKKLPEHKEIHAKLLGEGAFNKVYEINCSGTNRKYVARVTLPVNATNKTNSEAATLKWVKEKTKLPVQDVIAFDASTMNSIGYEWLLLSFVPGNNLSDKWEHVGMTGKEALTKQIATYVAATYNNKSPSGIGNLYPNNPGQVGEMVSMFLLLGGKYLEHGVFKGPYRNSNEWLESYLTLREREFESISRRIKSVENFVPIPGVWNREVDEEGVHRNLQVIRRLRPYVKKEFPPSTSSEETMLAHNDLSSHNIIVDDHGKLAAVIDWECVSVVPLWAACQYPEYLMGPDRHEKPDKKHYGTDRDTGKFTRIYGEHMEEWELTQLRNLFDHEMEIHAPGWIKVLKDSGMKRSVEFAVLHCDDEMWHKRILKWMDKLDKGQMSTIG